MKPPFHPRNLGEPLPTGEDAHITVNALRRTRRAGIFSLVAMLWVASAAPAQQVVGEEEAALDAAVDAEAGEEPEGDGDFSLFDLTARSTFFADQEGDGFGVGLFQTELSASTRLPVAKRAFVSLGGGWKRSDYDLDGLGDTLPGADGVDPLDTYSASLGLFVLQSERWSYFGTLAASVSGDGGADFDEALRIGGFGGVRYARSDRLSFSAGVGAFSQIEDDPIVIPVVGVEWQPTERWQVNIGVPETGVTFEPVERLKLFVRAEADFDDFRLSGDGPLDGAVLRDDGLGVAAGVEWRPTRRIELRAGVGSTFFRELTIDDADGDELLQADLGTGLFGTASLTVRLP